MVDGRKLRAGYCDDSEGAKALLEDFASAGVPASKLSIHDTPGYERADGKGVVVVQEASDVKLSSDEFSRFMTTANKWINSKDSTRWATDDERCLIVGYADLGMSHEKPTTPAEAGEKLADPKTMSDTETDESERFDVLLNENESGEYHVYDGETSRLYLVRLEGLGTEVMQFMGDGKVDRDLKREIVGSVIRQMPTYREGPEHYVSLEVNQTGGGGSGSGGTSDTGANDSDGEDENEDVFDSKGGHTEEIEQLQEWLEAYTAVKSALDPEGVDFDFGEVSVPDSWDTDYAGQTVEGVKIEASEPWGTAYHDGDSWTDKEGWNDHQTALREIMQNEDEILYFGSDYGYFNFVPTTAIDDVTN